MKCVHKKLNSTRGASLIFALLIFMLCAFAGAAALTAAAANAGRFSHAEHDQQQYLSVASAMDLLRGEMDSPKLVFTREFVETRYWRNDGGTPPAPLYELKDSEWTWYNGDTQISESESFLPKSLIEPYKADLEAAFVPSEWYTNAGIAVPGSPGPGAAYEKNLTITGDSENLREQLDEVQVKISLDPETYAITTVLGAGTDPDLLAYETTMLLPAVTSSNMESHVETSGSGDTGWTITTTTVTFTLEWPSDGSVVVQN